jgi:hypothetical protein
MSGAVPYAIDLLLRFIVANCSSRIPLLPMLMLGVRRAGVTDQTYVLAGMRAIKATRGNINVVDRLKLEDIAGGSYGVPEQEYEKHVGLPIRRS